MLGTALSALVTQNSEEVFSGGVGVADLETHRPIDPADRFRIGSITKTYAAPSPDRTGL